MNLLRYQPVLVNLSRLIISIFTPCLVHSFFSIGTYFFEMVITSLVSRLLLNSASSRRSTQMAFIDWSMGLFFSTVPVNRTLRASSLANRISTLYQRSMRRATSASRSSSNLISPFIQLS
jgi:hypothetical protein